MSLKRKLGAGKLVVSPCKLQILISLEDGTAIEPDRYRLGFIGWKKAERSKIEGKEEKWKKREVSENVYVLIGGLTKRWNNFYRGGRN